MSESSETQSVEQRLQRLKELNDFTEDARKQLDAMFEALGWSMDYNYNRDAMVQCPYDADHRVPVTSMERHKASCSRRKMGYSAEEEAEMCDPSVCYENSNSVRSFTMDKSTQHQVILQARAAAPLMRMEGVFWQGQYSGQPVDVPQNHKRSVCDLTVADRLALYEHAVQRGEAACGGNEDLYVDLVSKLQKDEDQNEPKTHLELMAEMRDYKRRRQSYRAKNVHITKKSYTEVIREVIRVHSGELSRQWREEEEEEEKEEEQQSTRAELSSHRRRLEEKRSASSESLLSKGRRHRSRERSPERESKKKRKKRERDSGSPDEHHHHHDRKKKKKKKREDKEKEK
ncbi:U11/U12 small nuclear ribonucleoprotein 48 kDa protein [Clinocottus analis]|uniref:U11/U12 small nuclear ribonucleoprotein 48 kDa protein n=1 Tax=Clinocottus analis TaxID=304258 RepID=UPI0035C17E97